MKIKISVHPLAAAGIFLLCTAVPPSRTFGIVAAVLCHEAAHIFVGRLFSMKVRRAVLLPLGITFEMDAPRSYAAEFAVAAAGPFVNILICALIKTGLFPVSAGVDELFLFSASFAALNLMPVRSLDGGTMLLSAASKLFSRQTAERILDVFGAAALAFMWLVGIYIFFYGTENFTLLLFVSFMFAATVMKNDSAPKKQNMS